MQPLFENRYTHDEEWAKDLFRWMYFRRPILWICYALFALVFALGVYDWIVWGRVNLLLLIYPPVFVAMIMVLASVRRRMTMKREVEMYGAPVETTLWVTDDEITAKQSNGTEYRLRYTDIKKVIQTARYVFLKSKTQVVYSFKKDGFTVGNADEFIEFLKSKGIRVK